MDSATRGSGGSSTGLAVCTVPGDQRTEGGATGETGDGMKSPELADTSEKTETRLLSRVAGATAAAVTAAAVSGAWVEDARRGGDSSRIAGEYRVSKRDLPAVAAPAAAEAAAVGIVAGPPVDGLIKLAVTSSGPGVPTR